MYTFPKNLLFLLANQAFLALIAAEAGINPTEYRNWAKSQIGYILGDTGRSYVVGFGVNPPTHEHHRAAWVYIESISAYESSKKKDFLAKYYKRLCYVILNEFTIYADFTCMQGD